MFNITLHLRGGHLPRLTRQQAAQLQLAAAHGVAASVKDNFKLMAERTSSRTFWHGAYAATQVDESRGPGKATVRVSQVGVRLQLLGGTVRPTGRPSAVTGKPTRSLLIPFEDSPLRVQGVTLREAGYSPESIFTITSRAGTPLLVAKDPQGKQLTYLGKLVSSSTHRPHPEVLPTLAAMRQEGRMAAREELKSILQST